MQCAITSFRVRSGTGAQNVTGIVDKNGIPFTPTLIMMLNGSTVLDTLWYNPTGLYNTATANINWYRASDGWCGYHAMGDLPQFGVKRASAANGNVAYASLEADAFFGGNVYRIGQITAVGLGFFTLNITHNLDYFTTDVIIAAFGGTDLEMQFLNTNGTVFSTSFEAKALFRLTGLAAAGGTSTGAGGDIFPIGWNLPNGVKGYSGASIFSASNSRIQLSNSYDGGHFVTSWGASSITVNATTTPNAMIFGGDLIRAAAGVLTQPVAAGNQTLNTGISTKFIMFVSVGAVSSSSAGTTAESCWGWTNGTNQSSFWFGETANAQPLKGASWLSSNTLLRFASAGANGASTVFDSIASITNLESWGETTINWSLCDGVQREILWFALGTVATNGPQPKSGAYKLVPGKTNDTVYVSFSPDTVENVAIPDPSATTALFGDEQ